MTHQIDKMTEVVDTFAFDLGPGAAPGRRTRCKLADAVLVEIVTAGSAT